MIEYRLDDLGWEGFERLVQSLLKARLGLGIEAWGGSGDWGRDAYFRGRLSYPSNESREGAFVFQSKFVDGANAAGAKADGLVLNAVRKECSRIESNLCPGGQWRERPVCYGLFTNAVLGAKTRVTLQQLIEAALPNSDVCIHDGGDVCAWLRLSPEIARSFEPLNEIASEIQSAKKAVKEIGEKLDLDQKSELRAKLKQAEELEARHKRDEATKLLNEVQFAAESSEMPVELTEALLGLAGIALDGRDFGEGERLLKKAEARLPGIAEKWIHGVFLRQRAFLFERTGRIEESEMLLLEAARLVEDDDKNARNQGVWAATQLVHLYCKEALFDDADKALNICSVHMADAKAPLLVRLYHEAAIHLAICRKHPDTLSQHITELKSSAISRSETGEIAGVLLNLANCARRVKEFSAGRSCAETAAELSQAHEMQDLAMGARYTVAALYFDEGDLDNAKRICLSIVDTVRAGKRNGLLQAISQLLSIVARRQGDPDGAVRAGELALSEASDEPEAVCMASLTLADALFDAGRAHEAFERGKVAFDTARATNAPSRVLIDALSVILDSATLLGNWEAAGDFVDVLSAIPVEKDQDSARRNELLERLTGYRQLRMRLEALLGDAAPLKTAATEGSQTVQAANAHVFQSLLDWWDEMPKAAAGLYDLWGRGNLWRLLLNLKAFPHTFNITIEVRTLDEIQTAIRLWALFADVLILLWKGPMSNGLGIVPFPGDYDGPGGWGYSICAGSEIRRDPNHKRQWYPAVGFGSVMPEEVIKFLTTDGRSLLKQGRLLLVPAASVGCVHPGHGPLEGLVADICNAIPCIRGGSQAQSVIGLLPYFPDAPCTALADVVGEHETTLAKLRLLLMRRSREFRVLEHPKAATKELELEIQDALSALRGFESQLSRKKGWSKKNEPFAGARLNFSEEEFLRAAGELQGTRPLASIGEILRITEKRLWSPIFTLESMGYDWRIGASVVPPSKARYAPSEGEAIGAWLSPPTAGWSIPTAIRA